MKRFLIILSSIFLIFFFSNQLNCEAGAASLSSIPEKSRLVLNSNGEITILLLADTQDIFPAQSDMIALQEACLDYSAPEFVIYLGDQISGPSLRSNEAKTKNAINNILLPTLERKIPFSFVFGNHDNEGGISKETQFAWYQEYDSCLAYQVDEITGVGNHMIPIYDSSNHIIAALWFFDSNTYAPKGEGKYAWVAKDQIEWYQAVSNQLKEQNNGKPVPGYVFQHIIVPEIYDALEISDIDDASSVPGRYLYDGKYVSLPSTNLSGYLKEGPCPPIKSDGQFDSWLTQGDIVAAFFGHDHVNSFQLPYQGIDLVACPGLTFFSYGAEDTHGARSITIHSDGSYTSELFFYEDLFQTSIPDLKVGTRGAGVQQLIVYGSVLIGFFILLIIFIIILLIKHKKKKGA